MYGGGSASKLTAGALAGILAVGMVPAAAFAEDEAIEPVDEAAIELQVASQKAAFESATVTVIDTVTGDTYTVPAAETVNVYERTLTINLKALGEKHALKVTGVSIQGADGEQALTVDKDYAVNAFDKDADDDGMVDADASTALDPAGVEDGEFIYIVADKKGDVDYTVDAGGTATNAIKITVSLKAPTVTWSAFEYAAAGTASKDKEVSDTEFAYTGAAAKVGLAANGVIINGGDGLQNVSGKTAKGIADTNYASGYAVIYSVPGITPAAADITKALPSGANAGYAPNTKDASDDLVSVGGTAPTNVGKYVAHLVKTADGSIVGMANFEVKALSLADAKGSDVPKDATTAQLKNYVKIGETTLDKLLDASALGQVTLTWDSAKDVDGNAIASFVDGNAAAGEYTYTLAPTTANDKNFTGSATVTFTVAGAAASTGAKAYYDENAIADGGTYATAFRIDRGEKFDPSMLVMYKGADDTAAAFASSEYSIKYLDDKNSEVELDKVNSEAGTYTVVVTIDAKATNYKFGGEYSFKITTTGSQVNTDNIFFTYNGKTVDKVSAVYDGTDVLSKIKVVVKDKKGNVLPESDFTLEAKKGSDKVTEIVNFGTDYTVEIKSDKYTFSNTNTKIGVSVAKAEPTAIRVAGTTTLYEDDGTVNYEYLPWTGEEITPTFEYTLADDPTAESAEWIALPESVYRISGITGAATLGGAAGGNASGDKVIKDDGDYTLVLTTGLGEGATNYDVTTAGAAVKLTISKAKQFQDVPATAWFAGDVAKAAANGYMNGIGGTNFFAPYEKLTRAQAAQIIFNMAGGADKATIADGTVDKNKEYTTKFSDVDGSAWYAQPIQWASNAGIVSGYAGTDQFKPNQNVTRQEFAKMLYQLAQLKGEDVKTDGSKWDAISDKGTVASWATNYVKWAVDKGIMGSNGWVKGNSDIIRAEAAKMSTVAQPEKL